MKAVGVGFLRESRIIGKQVRILYDLVTVCKERAVYANTWQPLANAGKAMARDDL